jgi:hypothetical protein
MLHNAIQIGSHQWGFWNAYNIISGSGNTSSNILMLYVWVDCQISCYSSARLPLQYRTFNQRRT